MTIRIRAYILEGFWKVKVGESWFERRNQKTAWVVRDWLRSEWRKWCEVLSRWSRQSHQYIQELSQRRVNKYIWSCLNHWNLPCNGLQNNMQNIIWMQSWINQISFLVCSTNKTTVKWSTPSLKIYSFLCLCCICVLLAEVSW